MQTIFLVLSLFVKQQMVGQNMNLCILSVGKINEVILSIKNASFFFTVWEFWGKMIYLVSLNQYNDLYLPKNKNMEVMTGLLMSRSSSLFIKGETQKLVEFKNLNLVSKDRKSLLLLLGGLLQICRYFISNCSIKDTIYYHASSSNQASSVFS